MRDGWFDLPGVQRGPRTLAEQMLGVEEALAEAKGATVWDMGCAEGLIAFEFAKAGARNVFACDCNPGAIRTAEKLRDGKPALAAVKFRLRDLNKLIVDERASGEVWRYDIVLALAVLHKLHDLPAAVRFAGDATGKLLVIRLPAGSEGVLQSKHVLDSSCDVREALPKCGLKLDAVKEGPRGELVHYWRR